MFLRESEWMVYRLHSEYNRALLYPQSLIAVFPPDDTAITGERIKKQKKSLSPKR
jgi:hypothetical protein